MAWESCLLHLLLMEGTSRTDQLIYRTSYRKHRQRLQDIRHNLTSHEFPLQTKLEDKKRQLMQRVRQQAIEQENKQLYQKIDGMKGKVQPHMVWNQPKSHHSRYQQESEAPLQVTSDEGQGEPLKCLLPAPKNRALSFWARNSQEKRRGASSLEDKSQIEWSNSIRQKQPDLQLQSQQMLYHLPQRNQQRKVVFKKTLMLSGKQSCLMELSLIGGRLLAVAYLMGEENYSIRELFSRQMTKRIFKIHQEDYESLCERLNLERLNGKLAAIRYKEGGKSINSGGETASSKEKERALLQQEFIKRNYYSLIKQTSINSEPSRREEPKHEPNQQVKSKIELKEPLTKIAVYQKTSIKQLEPSSEKHNLSLQPKKTASETSPHAKPSAPIEASLSPEKGEQYEEEFQT